LFAVYNDLGGSRRARTFGNDRICTVGVLTCTEPRFNRGEVTIWGLHREETRTSAVIVGPSRAARRSNPSGSRIIASRGVPSALDDPN
jgi:hypothetical protein